MKLRKQQSGFAALELVLIVVVLILIVGAGYYVMKQHAAKTAKNTAGVTSTAADSSAKTPAISSKQDLSSAADELKKVDTNTQKDEDSLRQSAE